MTESIADVVWQKVATNLEEICMKGRMVREEIHHPEWEGLPIAETTSLAKNSERASAADEPLGDIHYLVVTPPKEERFKRPRSY